ncbi:hypothetical protein CHS0354_031075 [Potamilus streckersoni]|uniref:Methyltransferase domain-containing protein n=1 Tax=Potamilus streckersoni TaxID=2493646 RepID=A0AAE0RZX4_9BIVA|nr:hypothetical protein CHS0354_031075 [Potamilus streckersoni]
MAVLSGFEEASDQDNMPPYNVFRSISISDDFPVKIPSDVGLDELTEEQVEELYWKINFQWDFDEDTTRLFGCEVFSFDPSMLNMSLSYKYTRYITFYKIGLGPRNEVNPNQWIMKTLGQIRRDLNHTKRQIDILKIDIEGSEWTSIPQMVMSGTLRSVKQMQIELHGSGTKHDLKVLRMLYEDGFRLFMRDRNQDCRYTRSRLARNRTACMEISMLRVMY